MTIIYTLEHPITEEIRYVGKTIKDLTVRLDGHKRQFDRSYRSNWIKSLIIQGLAPTIRAIEVVEDNVGSQTEIYWIAQFRTWGFRLTNISEGGDGYSGKRSKEHLAKVSKANKGRKLTKEWKSKISNTLTGRKQSPELVKKRFANLVNTQIKPIYQYYKGLRIAKYTSAREAAELINGSRDSIRNCALGYCKSSAGFQWKYE